MKKKRGQISVEWVTLIVFVSMMVIPGIYFLTQSFGDVKGDYEYYNFNSYLEEIAENGERMFFAGLFSKTTLTPDIGNDYVILNQVYTVTIKNLTWEQNYIIVNITDWDAKDNIVLIPSDIALRSEFCLRINNSPEYITECGGLNYNCTICLLNSTEFLYKNLQIEAIMNNDDIIVNLTYAK
jgi:hypothetical protein